MSGEPGVRTFDRSQAVLAACLLAVGLTIAQGALRIGALPGAPFRFRLLLATGGIGDWCGVLLVVAAIVGRDQPRARRAVQVLGGLVVAITLAGAGNWLTYDEGRFQARLGAVVLELAGGLLAVVAVWLTTSRALSAGGSRPAEGSA